MITPQTLLKMAAHGVRELVVGRQRKMLEPGDEAPDFSVAAHDGSTVKLSDYRGKKVLLWFYPKADTPG